MELMSLEKSHQGPPPLPPPCGGEPTCGILQMCNGGALHPLLAPIMRTTSPWLYSSQVPSMRMTHQSASRCVSQSAGMINDNQELGAAGPFKGRHVGQSAVHRQISAPANVRPSWEQEGKLQGDYGPTSSNN
ncbi:unnamed protein product [Pleuronectes platessa]|uniref:Uncharacterized protein n=1 Tax=Pleuronectes platessa TaxID=8262 RepID=A0A9N7U5D0_PLEPL|nr:unnamed protein product [Pleuronectes platessa]